MVRDWKHATGKDGALVKHDTSAKHQEAMSSWCAYKANLKRSTSVAATLDNIRKEQIVKNRHYLQAVIEAMLYCATLGDCSLWPPAKFVITFSQQRQFFGATRLLVKYDQVIHDRLNYGLKCTIHFS